MYELYCKTTADQPVHVLPRRVGADEGHCTDVRMVKYAVHLCNHHAKHVRLYCQP